MGDLALGARPFDTAAGLPAPETWAAITQLAAAYISHADGAGRDNPADLFIEAGVLTLGSLRLETRGAIARFFEERGRDHAARQRITRHVPGPMDMQIIEADRVAARSTSLVFAGHGTLPLAAGSPSTICDFDDVYRRTSDGWRFESRTATVVFVGAGAATFAK